MRIVLDGCSEHRADWLAARATGITASEISTVVGLNPWQTRYSLWQQKRKAAEGIFEDFDNETMYWGRKLERPIGEAVAERLGLPLTEPNRLYAHSDLPLLATPDRLVDQCIPIELKTTSDRYRDQWEDGLADHAQCQLMAQMMVLDAPYGYAACLVGGQRLYIHKLERDPILEGQIAAAATEFWGLVQSNTPPAVEGGDIEAVKLAHPDIVEEVLEVGSNELALLTELARLKEHIATLTKQKSTIDAQLLQFLGSARSAVGCGWKLERSLVERKGHTVAPSSYVQLKIKELK